MIEIVCPIVANVNVLSTTTTFALASSKIFFNRKENRDLT